MDETHLIRQPTEARDQIGDPFAAVAARPEFDALDADKSGYLEAPELAAVTMLPGVDRNGDGLISWIEYRKGAK